MIAYRIDLGFLFFLRAWTRLASKLHCSELVSLPFHLFIVQACIQTGQSEVRHHMTSSDRSVS
jgi:hypothetical protein